MTRRSMLLRSLGLGIAVYSAGALAGAAQLEEAIASALGERRVLVTVFLDGGLDMLSTLVPIGSDHRHEARLATLRPDLASAAKIDGTTVFDADPALSWHPAAAGLRRLWNDAGVGVAVAPAIGHSSPNYSHFTSKHFWEVGALDTGGTTGWLGRYLDRVGSPSVPLQGVSMGNDLSPLLATASASVATISSIDGYAYQGYSGISSAFKNAANQQMRSLATATTGDQQLDQARLVNGVGFALSDSLGAAGTVGTSAAAYPTTSSPFVQGLRDTARLLATRVSGEALPVRCVSLRAHGGYDTHGSQNPAFANNLKVTCDAIAAFWDDLRARGEADRVTMLVFSEFGRRPAQNGSAGNAGSDHGAAGGAFVIGPQVRQGLIGEFPGLAPYGSTGAGLMQDGNLRATADFRGLYSALLEQWLQTDADGIIPGAGASPGASAFARPVLF